MHLPEIVSDSAPLVYICGGNRKGGEEGEEEGGEERRGRMRREERRGGMRREERATAW